MLKARKAWWPVLMLMLCMSIQAQDFGYWVNTSGVIYKVSLSTGEAVEQSRLALTEGTSVKDAMHSGDSVIYLAVGETLIKYSITQNDFEEITTLSNHFNFETVLNDNQISLEIIYEEPVDPMPQGTGFLVYRDPFILNLTDLSLTPTDGTSIRYGALSAIRNQIDSTLWLYARYPEGGVWKQHDTLTGEQNLPFFISEKYGVYGLAFHLDGRVFWAERRSGVDWFLTTVGTESGSIVEIGYMGELEEGILVIPSNNIQEGKALYISTPTLGLFSRKADFEPIHWQIKTVNTGTESFTIDSIRWSNSLLSIAGPLDDITLTQGDKMNLEFTYTPENEDRISDVLRVYANSEGLYREIPVAASMTLGFDENTVPALDTDNLLLKEGEEIVERNKAFEKVNTLSATCDSCRHSISPRGRLFRFNEENLLSVYDPTEGVFEEVADLSGRFDLVEDFTFEDDHTLVILVNRRQMLDRSGPMEPSVPASIFQLFRYDIVADSVLHRLYYHLVFDDEAAVKGLPVALEYDYEVDKFMLLYNTPGDGTSEIRISHSIFRPSDRKEFKSALFNDFYKGHASSWFGLQSQSIFHLDQEQQKHHQVTSLDIRPDEIIGFGSGGSTELRLSHQHIDFGQVFLERQELASISLENLSNTDIVLETIEFDNPELSNTQDLPLQIPAGTQSRALEFGFLAQSVGMVNGAAVLTFFDGDLRWERLVRLKGRGVESSDVIELGNAALDFGEVYMGEIGLKTLRVNNLSAKWVEVQSISFDHNGFSYSGELPVFIKPGEAVLLRDFVARLGVGGETNGNATIMFNDGFNSWETVVPLKVNVAREVDLSSLSIDFGRVNIDSELIRSITINNKDSSAPVRINGVSIDNPVFKIEPFASVDIDASMADSPISFSFKPDQEAVESGVAIMSFSRNGVSWSVPVDLRGEGVQGGLVTSVEEEGFLTGMSIFPNPLRNMSQLSFRNVNPKVQELQFYNLHGQLQHRHYTESLNEFNLDLSDFTSEGMVLIRFLSKEGKHLGSRSVLIQR